MTADERIARLESAVDELAHGLERVLGGSGPGAATQGIRTELAAVRSAVRSAAAADVIAAVTGAAPEGEPASLERAA